MDERAAIARMVRGHRAAEARARALRAAEGPKPEQAIAHALSALEAAAELGRWPGPRDPGSERAVRAVRRRWAKIQRRARTLARR